MSASQLYHYFAGKTDLVRAVIAHQRAAVLSRHRSMLSTVDGPVPGRLSTRVAGQ